MPMDLIGTETYDLFMSGKFMEAVFYPFTSLMGDWFFLLLFGLGITMIYLKSQDLGTTGIAGMILFPVLMPILPIEAHFIVYSLLLLALTTILYKVFH